MDQLFSWTAAALAAYHFAGYGLLENDPPATGRIDASSRGGHGHESGVFSSSTNAQSFEGDGYLALSSPPMPGEFLVSPPRPPLKRRARRQHGSPKRRKVSAEAYKPGSYSSTKTKKRHGNSKSPSSEDLETRVKIGLPYRTLSAPSTPVSHGRDPSLKPSSIEDAGPYVQMVHRSALVPSSPSPFVDATSGRGQPWPLVANNVVIGRKRSAPVEFDKEVSSPHPKRYITGWMSEYIRLRARSWREMLRAMQAARWRPFRPQVIRYLAPAPASAPSIPSRCRRTNPVTGTLLTTTTTSSSAHRAETTPPPSTPAFPPDGLSPFFPATTTPPYSPQESPPPFTPFSSPDLEVEVVTSTDPSAPPSSVANSLTWLAQDSIAESPPSISRISWVDKGKWRADVTPGLIACGLDPIVMDDRIPIAIGVSPSPLSTSFLAPPPSPVFPNVSPLSATQMKSSHLPHPPPHSLAHPPSIPLPPPVSPSALAFKPFKTIKRSLRSKAARANPYKMDYLRLRSEVKWRLKDLGFKFRPAPPPSPAVLTRPEYAVPMLVRIGSIPALLWPASIFNTPPPVPVVPTPRRNDLDDNTRISVLASLDFPKRAYRPRRRRRLIPAESEPMREVEFY